MAVTLQYTPTGRKYYRAGYKGLYRSYYVAVLGRDAERQAQKQFKHWAENKDLITKFKKSLEL